ncbi:MAG: DUF6132 family protein [Bacteroidales bacterium]|nr:DUF6132 family protein [Bacteroidales bacterium]MDD4821794.1 DUF6132 family protein [Bacteroidales bacterium]
MKELIKKHYLNIIGVLTGSLAGYLYYLYVGCTTGSCPITSNPYMSIAYGALMGYLVFDLFKKKKHGTN